MTLMRVAAISLIAFIAAACNPSSNLLKVAGPEYDARARHFIQLLSDEHYDSLTLRMRPEVARASAPALAQITTFMAHERLDSVQLVGANRTHFSDGRQVTTLVYQARKGAGWIAVNVITVDSAGSSRLEGMRVDPLPGELSKVNAFTLRGRSVGQYAFLLVLIFCFASSVGTAVYIATRRGFPKRWLWTILSLIGVCSLQLNWTTGQFQVRPINIQLFSAGFVRMALVSPWILTASLPVGALLALLRYTRFKSRKPITRESSV